MRRLKVREYYRESLTVVYFLIHPTESFTRVAPITKNEKPRSMAGFLVVGTSAAWAVAY
jgi:hypothetical protein